jgi:hypothetical protein
MTVPLGSAVSVPNVDPVAEIPVTVSVVDWSSVVPIVTMTRSLAANAIAGEAVPPIVVVPVVPEAGVDQLLKESSHVRLTPVARTALMKPTREEPPVTVTA